MKPTTRIGNPVATSSAGARRTRRATRAMSQSSGASVRGPGSVSAARPATHCCTSLRGVVK
ncbi:unnamed protein product [Symbiodinium sp. CCMP2592]|nr:unnamed protein product [Symbiodinium sp. CCMP2592]